MRIFYAAPMAALLLGGCYPMEQAPLVYASKQTIGLSLTGGTTDNPGLDLIIGYKDTNVALVPVVVAKRCPPTSDDCEHNNYQMTVVTGGRSDELDSGGIRLQLEEARRDFGSYEADLSKKSKARLAETLIIDSFARKQSDQAALSSLQAGFDGLDTSRQASINDLIDRISRNSTSEQQRDQAVTARNGLDIDIETLEKQRDEALGRARRLEGSLSASESAKRNDAYSVYGTFAGSANGDAEGGALNGDRVFATGIAAQNLTESLGFASCLAKIDKVAAHYKDDAERKAFMDKALEYCGKTKGDK